MGRTLNDLTGQRFGKLIVLQRNISQKDQQTYWDCLCDCGNVKIVTGGNLKKRTISCGCSNSYKNISGQKFGKLEVLYKDLNPKDRNRTWFICKCECGNIKSIRSGDIQNGNAKSCGCSTHEGKHGSCYTAEYEAWKGMKRRCLNSKTVNYKNYGGRGITVCDEWINSFEIFFKDMGQKPTNLHSIDRIDNNGNYCKDNCKWSTRIEQNRNKRSNKISSKQQADEIRQKFQIGTYTLKQLGVQYNCDENNIRAIINNETWI